MNVHTGLRAGASLQSGSSSQMLMNALREEELQRTNSNVLANTLQSLRLGSGIGGMGGIGSVAQ